MPTTSKSTKSGQPIKEFSLVQGLEGVNQGLEHLMGKTFKTLSALTKHLKKDQEALVAVREGTSKLMIPSGYHYVTKTSDDYNSYCLSGDPIHYGHIDTATRAAQMFEHVHVGIGVDADKKGLFTPEERVHLATKALGNLPNVSVDLFKGLAVDYARMVGARTFVRGSRNPQDFEYEHTLCLANNSLDFGIDTVILPSKKFHHVSSSAVRAIVKECGDVTEYVPLHVKQALEVKILGQYRVGLTGEMGMGKSYVAQRWINKGCGTVCQIELDEITNLVLGDRYTYHCYQDDASVQARQEILKVFGTLNRKLLAEKVFASKEGVETLNHIMSTPVMLHVRQALREKYGVVVINCASLMEWGLNTLCNNNVAVVMCKHEARLKRLAERRGISENELLQRQGHQWSTLGKIQQAREVIRQDGHGHLWILSNNHEWTKEDNHSPRILNSIGDRFGVCFFE